MMRQAVKRAMIVALATQPVLLSAQAAKVSKLGSYSGYAPVLYDGHVRSSQYVTMRDGTRIAIDIVRPTLNGQPVTARLPVVWMNTPYNRRKTDGGDTAQSYPGGALALVRRGYVIAIADMRGGFASFGRAVTTNRTQWMADAYWDAYDTTEWLAKQPWSTGKIGMWGCSATGHTQWQAAASRPPSLRAIMALSAPSEYYDWGGIAPVLAPPPPVATLPGPVPARDKDAAAVDADSDGKLLAAAKDDHRWNFEPGYMPYRDSASPEMAAHRGKANFRNWLEVNTFPHMAAIAKSGIGIYQSANYGEDIRVKQGIFVKAKNVGGTIKTILGPGRHCSWSTPYETKPDNAFDITVEELRWYDHWLKGVDNGVTREPAFSYYTYNAAPGTEWRQTRVWPLPTQKLTPYYFGASRTLVTATPTGDSDAYTTDYAVTLATAADKAMTYTTAPLAADTTVTGHPVVHLWVSSTATDGDFVANLFDIAPDGTATPIPGSEDGRLRASHRALGTAPYDNLGLPYHRSFKADVKPLKPGEPVELAFDLAPLSWVFKAGHSVRLAIANVAASRRGAGGLTPEISPPPVVTYYRDPARPSRIVLPIVPTVAK